MKGIREAFVIAFLNVKTRQVVLSPATLHPNEEWAVAQSASFVNQARAQGLPVRMVRHDRDTKFTKAFDAKLKSRRVQIIRLSYRSPNTNAFVERFIQSIEQECLDRFVAFGEKHLEHLCSEYLAYYHEERPHQALENELIRQPEKRGLPKTKTGDVEDETKPLADLWCRRRLGGLLKSYHRSAA